MQDVVLAKAYRLGRLRRAGERVEVDDETLADLISKGVVRDPNDVPVVKPEVVPVPPSPAAVPEPASGPKRGVPVPKPTAPIAKWREWAESEGYPTKGLSKQEIIALSR